MRYRTATDYGPGICIRVRIPYRTVRIRILILLWRVKIKLLGGRIRPVLGSGPSRTGLSHLGIAFEGRAMPTMEGTVQEDDYWTEVRFKDKNPFKN